jgi:D-lactate dehydrogenase (cytochrome)
VLVIAIEPFMSTHRIIARPPRGLPASPPISHDADTLRSFLEDAAHFPGGHADAVAFPRSEADVAFLLQHHARVLPIGAQSSVTGGATPRGELILSTAKLAEILHVGTDSARVQPGVSLAVLQEAMRQAGRYYPPAATYEGALVGGTIATNASGAATFKYGSTRDWIRHVTVVMASGEVLDIERGAVHAHPEGFFEIVGGGGNTRVPVPTYRMPDVPKRSAGYFAAPGMDLIDLFIGSEGTLGVVVEATLKVKSDEPSTCLALVPFAGEADALAVVTALRRESVETRRLSDPRGLDVSAIESMDRRCLRMLAEDGLDRKNDVVFPPDAGTVLLVQIELPPGTGAARAFDQIAGALEPGAPDTPLVRFVRILDRASALDHAEMAMPGDRKRAQQFFELREGAPSAVKQRIALAKERVDRNIEKTAADMIVPFERFAAMMAVYRAGFERRGLDYAIWGHISDGNVHPNVIPRSLQDVVAGKEAILEFGREVVGLGGCPLAEHGVGRSPVKQALLRQLYGDEGVAQMQKVKAALDPEWKLSPGVLFPAAR